VNLEVVWKSFREIVTTSELLARSKKTALTFMLASIKRHTPARHTVTSKAVVSALHREGI
jgi:hypothetical protein